MTRLLNAAKFLLVVMVIAAIGFTVGLMVVVLPPLAWIGVIGVAAAVLIWVMPELPLVSPRLVVALFFVSFASQIIFPSYYAFAAPGLPWISLRRLTWFPMVLALSLMIASSSAARRDIARVFSSTKIVFVLFVAFVTAQFLSSFTSINPSDSIKDFSNAILYWYMAMLAVIVCVTTEARMRTVFLIVTYVSVFAGIMGFIEFYVQNHFIAKIWPESIIAELFAANPGIFENITRNILRGGQYRANFIYNVSLSYGEFLAVTAPMCLYFALHGRDRFEIALGVLACACCLIGVYASGSRGAMLGAAVAVPMIVGLWIVRTRKRSPNSMIGPIAIVVLFGVMSAFVTLMFVSTRFRATFTGGAESTSSTDARFDQWRLAVPKIIANPVTGHGTGLGAEIVGYAPFGELTVDSYVISLLVETGVPGFIGFFGMLLCAAYLLVRLYLKDDDPFSSYAAALASALVSFGLYRLVLSQRENHILFFVIMALALVQLADSRARPRSAAAPTLRRPAPAEGRRGPGPRRSPKYGGGDQRVDREHVGD